MNSKDFEINILTNAIARLADGFSYLPQHNAVFDRERAGEILLEVAERLKDNYPYFHPYYMGQMLKPPHPIARIAYQLSLFINPNNHALDGGRASSAMEKEAIQEIAAMFGWKSDALGHLCGGGTIANLEALWISKKLHPKLGIVASEQAHYTHQRICNMLEIPFESIQCDKYGRLSIQALERKLQAGTIGTAVITLGSTGLGAVDPLHEVVVLRSKYNFRIHVDAAYGGYFTLAQTLKSRVKLAFQSIKNADSIAVDPHKHGLQPHGCGCILFKDNIVGQFYKHDSPYTYFSSEDLHLGEISLECSRSGAAAVSLWATQKLFPLVQSGDFAQDLESSCQAAINLHQKLNNDKRFITPWEPDLNIVVWMPRDNKASKISQYTRQIFSILAHRHVHLALIKLSSSFLYTAGVDIEWDQEEVVCFRACVMKPEHLQWIDRIWEEIDAVTKEVMST